MVDHSKAESFNNQLVRVIRTKWVMQGEVKAAKMRFNIQKRPSSNSRDYDQDEESDKG